MKTIGNNTTERVVSLDLTEETVYISEVTDIPYDTVSSIIKGIDAYYYLMGIQNELTFEDEEEMFIGDSIQPRDYNPDYIIEEDEMLAFISSHTDISDEIIESVMTEDLKYQCAIEENRKDDFMKQIVIQRCEGQWTYEQKAALVKVLTKPFLKPLLADSFRNPIITTKVLNSNAQLNLYSYVW